MIDCVIIRRRPNRDTVDSASCQKETFWAVSIISARTHRFDMECLFWLCFYRAGGAVLPAVRVICALPRRSSFSFHWNLGQVHM